MRPHAGIEGGRRRPETPLLKGPGVLSGIENGARDSINVVRYNLGRILIAVVIASSGIAAQIKKALADTVYCGTDQPRLVKETAGTEAGDTVIEAPGMSDWIGGIPKVRGNLVFQQTSDYENGGTFMNVYDNASLEKLARLDIINIDYISEEGVIIDRNSGKCHQLVETPEDPVNKYTVVELGMVAEGGGIISHGGYFFEMAITGKYPSYTKVLRAVSIAKIQQSQPGETVGWDKEVKIIDKLGGTDFVIDTTKTPPTMLYAVQMKNGDYGYAEMEIPDGTLDWMVDYPITANPSIFKKTPFEIGRIVIDQTNGDRYFIKYNKIAIESGEKLYQIPLEVCSEYIKTITPLPGSGGVYIVEEGSKLPRIIIPEGNPPPGGIDGLLVLDVVATDKLKENGIPYKIWTYLKAGPGEIGDFPIDVDKETIEGCVAAPSKKDDPSLTSPCQDKTCDDINACTKNDCNDVTGACEYPPVANGTPCDDNNPNTINDSCQNGECKGATPPPPDNQPDNQIPDKTPPPEIEMEEESDKILDASEEATEAEETEKEQDTPDVIENVELADAEDAVDPTDAVLPEKPLEVSEVEEVDPADNEKCAPDDETVNSEQEGDKGTEPPDKTKTDNPPDPPDITPDNTTEKPDIPIPPPDQGPDVLPPQDQGPEEVSPPESRKSGGGGCSAETLNGTTPTDPLLYLSLSLLAAAGLTSRKQRETLAAITESHAAQSADRPHQSL